MKLLGKGTESAATLAGRSAADRDTPALVDARFYEAARPHSLAERLTAAARNRIYDDFLRLMTPAPCEQILDVGVSDVVNDAANMLERMYPHPEALTAVGLGRAEGFQAAFPQVRYRQVAPNVALPFDDQSFDIAVSNAVVEHVGSPDNQIFFVSELARVARRVFISAPHRYFPVEHHTAIPILHFWRPAFRVACHVTRKLQWLDEANLILMSRRALADLAPTGRQAVVGYTGLPLGAFSSNLFMVIKPPE